MRRSKQALRKEKSVAEQYKSRTNQELKSIVFKLLRASNSKLIGNERGHPGSNTSFGGDN